jgi:alanine racemase
VTASRTVLNRVTATVDLSALRDNLACVRRYAPCARVMAPVKANAYGHGAVPVARALAQAGADALAVACLEEAILLRDVGIQAPVTLLEGVLSAEELCESTALGLQLVVHDEFQLGLLQRLPTDQPVSLWFKFDSGMHRLGFPLAEASRLAAVLAAHPNWQLQGWMTHLACADELDNDMTLRQITAFDTALSGLPGPRSIANSAGLLAWPAARRDWVRPGLMLYGASPLPVGPPSNWACGRLCNSAAVCCRFTMLPRASRSATARASSARGPCGSAWLQSAMPMGSIACCRQEHQP